jgi:hypothetical protein
LGLPLRGGDARDARPRTCNCRAAAAAARRQLRCGLASPTSIVSVAARQADAVSMQQAQLRLKGWGGVGEGGLDLRVKRVPLPRAQFPVVTRHQAAAFCLRIASNVRGGRAREGDRQIVWDAEGREKQKHRGHLRHGI